MGLNISLHEFSVDFVASNLLIFLLNIGPSKRTTEKWVEI